MREGSRAPAAEAAARAPLQLKAGVIQALKPLPPAPPQGLPLVVRQRLHRQGCPGWILQKLAHQGRAGALIRPQQGLAQGQRQQAEALPPGCKRLLQPRWLPRLRRRQLIGVAGADRAEPRLPVTHLAGQGDHPTLAIQQEQVAVAAHQLQQQRSLARVAGPGCEVQLHHPLPGRLLQPHEGQTAQAVLQLLSQGAAIPMARRRRDRQQPRRLRQPAQLQPLDPLQAAQTQLQGVGVTLLRLLETAGHQQRLKLAEHRPQAGVVERLQGRGRWGRWIVHDHLLRAGAAVGPPMVVPPGSTAHKSLRSAHGASGCRANRALMER